MNKRVSVPVVVFLVIGSLIIGFQIENIRGQKAEYIQTFGRTMTTIHMQAQLSMFICTVISNTWGSAQRNLFASEKDKVVKLTSDFGSRGFYKILEGNKERISTDLRRIQNPPSGLKEAYDLLLDMDGLNNQLYDLAKSPGGTLENYSASVNAKYNELVQTYNKITYLLPR